MVRLDDTRKVMRFSFAMVCEECIKDEQRMKSIADRVFVETKPIDVALASEGRAHAVCEECSKLVSRQVFTTMTITDTECEACGTAIKKFDAVSVSPNQWAEIQATHAKNYYAVCVGCADLLSGEPFNCVSISDTRCDACGSTIVPWNATQVDLGQWNRIQTKRRSKVKQVE